MRMRTTLQSRIRVVFMPLLLVALGGYFSFHMINGDRGLLAYHDLSLAIAEAKQIQKETHQKRVVLEHRVSLLRPESLDLDMVEERARVLLDLARPGDVVVLGHTL